jgi:hypothetical protein
MSAKSALQDLLGFLADLHDDAREMLSDDVLRNEIIRDLGGTPSPNSPQPQFPPAGLESVTAYRDASEPGLDALLAAIQDFRGFYEALRGFTEALNLGGDAAVEEAHRALLDLLGWNIVRLRMPKLYFWMQVASFAEDITSPFPGQFNGTWPFPTALDRLFSAGMDLYGLWERTHFNSDAGVRRLSDQIALGSLMGVKLGGLALEQLKKIPGDNVVYGVDFVPGVRQPEPPPPSTPAADAAIARAFTINFIDTNTKAIEEGTETDVGRNNLVVTLALVPRPHGGPGVFASFGGGINVETQLAERLHFIAELQAAGAFSVLIGRRKFAVRPPTEGSDFHGTLAIEARPDPLSGKAFDLALGKGTGLSAELVRLEGSLSNQRAQLKTQILGGVASISPATFDNFIGKILPKDGLRLNFDIGIGAATDRGKFIEGQVRSAGTGGGPRPTPPPPPGVQPPPLPPLPPSESTGPGFGLTIPIGKSLGPLTMHNLQLRVGLEGPDDDRTYLLNAASSISAKLGPVTARVDRIGLSLAVRFPKPPQTPNLGFCDLDVGALLPNGVGLAIDAKGIVTGGGFLYHDKQQELYAGVMDLTVKERIAVKAFGLIQTKMPDGSEGYSLVVFITAEGFTPIQIGMGATLRGIGGMVAINRTFDQEAMREGLKNKTLGTLLFPKDPIRNAPEIIRNLVTTFPAEQGGFLIGVILKIAWFSPPLVHLDIAIMIELGNRMRVIALGIIKALLPTQENDLVRLQMDAMGVINVGRMDVEIDAVLVDSRLAHKFVLTGNMALRASALRRSFLMSVGGFNPRFTPPMGMPKLQRITIALASGANPRLTCESYFAITSNTVQFGARAELYAAAFGFSIEGEIGYDVLIQLLPFRLVADFRASVQLKRGSRSLFKLSVEGMLEGPRPLRIAGKASFEIFWCDFTIRFDKTLISGDKPPLPPAVDVLAELKRALTSADSWSTQLAPNRQHGVTLRKAPPSTVLVLDPLGNLVVKQQIVPLNTSRELDTFGGAPIAGARRFTVKASLGVVGQDANPVQDAFAPAQFFAMTDDEKLVAPSFTDMDAGVIFGSDAVVIDEGASIFDALEYETLLIDEDGAKEQQEDYPLPPERFFQQVRFSAVGLAPIRSVGIARFRNLAAPAAVTLRAQQFGITSVETGAAAPETRATSFVDAQAALARLNRSTPGATARWQLVPEFEMTAEL